MLILQALDDPQNPQSWLTRFSANGQLKITYDEDQQATRFVVAYPEGSKSNWLYPAIVISEADKQADFLEFQIRAEGNPEGRGFRNAIVLFQDRHWKNVGQIYYPTPDGTFKQVRLNLQKLQFDFSKTWIIRIGVNFKDAAEGALWLRNVKFVKAEPAPTTAK